MSGAVPGAVHKGRARLARDRRRAAVPQPPRRAAAALAPAPRATAAAAEAMPAAARLRVAPQRPCSAARSAQWAGGGRASPYVRARGGAARPSGRRGGRGLDGAGVWAGQKSPGLWEPLEPSARACCCSRFFTIWLERPVSLGHMEWNDSAGPEPRDLTSAPPAEPRSTFLLRPVTVSQPRLY